MAERQYRPGSRNAKFRARHQGRMSDSRVAWLKTAIGQFVAMRYLDPTEDENGVTYEDNEIGPTYMMILPRPGAKPVKYNLTALTLEELQLTRQFFNMLFDLAEPIVAHRDKVAQDAADEGDDSYARYYRVAPQLVVRSGTLRADDQSILDGSSDDAGGDAVDGDSDGGVRGDGDDVASEDAEDRSPEDPSAQAD